MSRKKQKKIHCIIFNKVRFKKKDVEGWLRTNRNILDSDKLNIKRSDKDYICFFRGKNKFRKLEKNYYHNAKIFKGFLK